MVTLCIYCRGFLQMKVSPENHKTLEKEKHRGGKHKTLEEDEDQGEMDVVFFLSTVLYTSYLLSIELIYDKETQSAVNMFHLIVSNVWAFYPLMQAQGLWLKLLVASSAYFSVVWHWTADVKLPLPHDKNLYGKGDSILSILTIVSYCLSWVPKAKVYEPTKEEKKKVFYKYCRGKPKETAEWRCRWTYNLCINIVFCFLIGVLLYFTNENDNIEEIQIAICWASISIAVVSALYQLHGEKITVTKQRKFAFWVAFGSAFGIIAFIHKVKPTTNAHCVWHVMVMSCAYSFSRASEYLDVI